MNVFPECQRCLSFVLPSRLVAVRGDDEVHKQRCRASPWSRLFHWCSACRPQHIPVIYCPASEERSGNLRDHRQACKSKHGDPLRQ